LTLFYHTERIFIIFVSFPGPLLRNDLIDNATNSYLLEWPQREFLLLLLSAQTKSLILDNFSIDYKTDLFDFGSFLIQVVKKAPNLVHLSFSSSARNQPSYTDLFPNDLRRLIVELIGMLKNLQHLNMYEYFGLDTDNLINLTKNLKNLVCLKV